MKPNLRRRPFDDLIYNKESGFESASRVLCSSGTAVVLCGHLVDVEGAILLSTA